MMVYVVSGIFIFTCCSFFCQGKQILEVTDQIYFDFDKDGFHEGRVVIGLFGKDVPKTVKNFKTIALEGIDNKTYVGTRFHTIVKNFMIQGGDILTNNGKGSISIYGPTFEDENFKIHHTASGFVSMANTGPNSNGCQFFITCSEMPWLDGHHTIFGKVLSGMEAVREFENFRISKTTRKPVHEGTIRTAGEIPTPEPFLITDEDKIE